MTMLILAAFAFPGGLLGLLFKIAIVCIVCWGIWELVKWLGVTIPRPVQIILICVVCIILVYWLFEALQLAL